MVGFDWLLNCSLGILRSRLLTIRSPQGGPQFMTGFFQHASQHSLVCRICSSPIALETSNTDEHGRAVHEECYVSTTISKFRLRRAGHLPKSWLSAVSVAYD